MAQQQWIQSVYPLASLPAPLDAAHGRIQASVVTSFSKSRKRKRAEIATAIDGEAINIYSVVMTIAKARAMSHIEQVEDPNLAAAYAVSPDTCFQAPPCSLYHKAHDETPAKRVTYAATNSSRSPASIQMACYEEKLQAVSAKPAGHRLASTAPLVLLDAVPVTPAADAQIDRLSHEVVSLQKDGSVCCFSPRLETLLWTADLSSTTSANNAHDLPEGFELVHAELHSLSDASKGLLKNRQDVISTLNAVDPSRTWLLIVLATSSSNQHAQLLDLDVHVYTVPLGLDKRKVGSRSTIQQIFSCSLPPAIQRARSIPSAFLLSQSVGSVTELHGTKIATYDVTGIQPQVSDVSSVPQAPKSMIRASSTILLTANATRFVVYDMRYGSVLAKHEHQQNTLQEVGPAEGDEGSLETKLVGYLPKAAAAIALRGRTLLAIEFSDRIKSRKTKGVETSLIDSLGKGSLSSKVRRIDSHEKRLSGNRKHMHSEIDDRNFFTSPEFDTLLDENRVNDFDDQFAAVVNLGPAQNETESEAEKAIVGRDQTPSSWRFPPVTRLRNLHQCRPQALYVLSKIFDVGEASNASETGHLRFKCYPENIFMWLVHTGQLRADLIQRAINEYFDASVTVMHGQVMAALAEEEESLALVHYALSYHPNLPIEEIVSAIKLLIDSLDTSTLPQPGHKAIVDDQFAEAAATTGALTGGVSEPKDIQKGVANGELDVDAVSDAEAEADAVMKDADDMVDQAYEALDNLLPIRGESMRLALTKLNAHPAKLVTKTLRSKMTQHELLFLIHILRIELHQGGWTTRYGERWEGEDLGSEEPSNGAILVIANILSCAVDAIGMSGWLTTTIGDSFDNTEETLSLLRTEISATLEGIHESVFIEGVLSDFLRHAYRRETSDLQLEQPRKDESQQEAVWKKGQTTVVENPISPRLPLGLGLENAGVRTRVDAMERLMDGRLMMKSGRYMGKEVRKGLPPYVFERIRF